MTGRVLYEQVYALLQESSSSGAIDTKLTYDFLYEAATEVVRRTECLTGEQTITTVALQAAYNLNSDFLAFYVRDSLNRLQVKFYDGNAYSWLTYRPYEAVYYANNLTSMAVPIPFNFSLRDNPALPTNITGTATSGGTVTNGECTLNGAGFTNVTAGSEVGNSTDGSYGIVVEYTSATALVTSMFGGTNDDWTTSDAYVVIPQPRKQIILDPPPLTAGYVLTVPYLQKPAPVYSPYRQYRLDDQLTPALAKYAAWLYKYRDREPNYGDAWFKHFEMQVRKIGHQTRKAYDRYNMRVNFNKQSYSDRSYR